MKMEHVMKKVATTAATTLRVAAPMLRLGLRVTAGEGTIDEDFGIIHKIHGADVFVGWESGSNTWIEACELRIVGSRCF